MPTFPICILDPIDHLFGATVTVEIVIHWGLGVSTAKLQILMAAAGKPFLSLQNYGVLGHAVVVVAMDG